MKIYLVLIYIFIINDAKSQEQNALIYGKSNPDDYIIKLYIPDYFTGIKKVIAFDTIKNNGDYHLKYNLKKALVAILGEEKVILTPKDSIKINFGEFEAGFKNYNFDVREHQNKKLYTFFKTISPKNRLSSFGGYSTNPNDYYTKDSNFLFENYLVECQKERRVAYSELNKIITLKNRQVKKIIQAELETEYMGMLLKPMIQMTLKNKIPKNYLQEINVFNRDIQNSIDFPWVMEYYLKSIILKKNKIITEKDINLYFKKVSSLNINNTLKTGLYYAIANSLKKNNDSLIYSIFRNMKKVVPITKKTKYEKDFSDLLNFMENLVKRTLPPSFANANILDTTRYISTIKNLLSNTKNEEIFYIDFWASWCVPCLKEMRFYEDNIKLFDSLKIKRILISVDEEFENWKSSIDKNQFTGFSYFLPNASYYRKILQIEHIPRYILLDSKMKIISNDAPRPFDYKKIESLINVKNKQ